MLTTAVIRREATAISSVGKSSFSGSGTKWNKIGEAGDIYGGAAGLIGTDPKTGYIRLYHWDNKTWNIIGGPEGKMWAVGGTMKEFGPPYVYGLSLDRKQIRQWNGDMQNWQWLKIGDAGKEIYETIYAGGDKVFAVSQNWNGISVYSQKTKKWDSIGGPGEMWAVEPNSGDLCGLATGGQAIFRHLGGKQWERIGNIPAKEIWMCSGYISKEPDLGGSSRIVIAQNPKTFKLSATEYQI